MKKVAKQGGEVAQKEEMGELSTCSGLFGEATLYDHSYLTQDSQAAKRISKGELALPGRAPKMVDVEFAWFAKNMFQKREEPVFSVGKSGEYYFASAFTQFESASGEIHRHRGCMHLPAVRP